MTPLVYLGLGLGALALAGGKKKSTAAPAPGLPPGVPPGMVPTPGAPAPAQSVAQRMATALATQNPTAIRFEAMWLAQNGYPQQSQALIAEAVKLEQAQAHATGYVPAPAPVAPPVVVPHPAVTSPGIAVIHPPSAPVPVPVPPVVVQTPAGPVAMPQPAVIVPPAPVVQTPPIVVQTPAGPVSIPSVTMPPPVAVPSFPVVPLPSLAKGQTLSSTNPGQTTSPLTLMVQNKLVSLGLLTAADVAGGPGKYGPKTVNAVKQFQMLANAYLLQRGPVFLPTAQVTVSALKVDGVWGNQSNDMAALAHPPQGTGASATVFGSLDYAPAEPLPASPLPGLIPEMAPKPIDPNMALAARVAANLSSTVEGQEDRNLVQLLQAAHGLKASGYYNPETAWLLASRFQIVPPKPRYWVTSGRGKSKRNYRKALLELASKDPQRVEEWTQAAQV